MTRLKEGWIKDISTTIKTYEGELISKTGLDFVSLASAASNVSKENIIRDSKNNKVAIIPITTGLGIIGSFVQSVAAIVECMGFETFITDGTDVQGIYEAYKRGAKTVFLADDDRFIALNFEKNILADNNIATARGFVAALEGAAGNIKDKEVLVIGCGIVGREAIIYLREKGAYPIAYDKNKSILSKLSDEGFNVLTDEKKIGEYKLIVDATCEGSWLHKDMLHPDAWIATPGVPLSLDDEAYEVYKNRLVHDLLPIGVATMMAMTCK